MYHSTWIGCLFNVYFLPGFLWAVKLVRSHRAPGCGPMGVQLPTSHRAPGTGHRAPGPGLWADGGPATYLAPGTGPRAPGCGPRGGPALYLAPGPGCGPRAVQLPTSHRTPGCGPRGVQLPNPHRVPRQPGTTLLLLIRMHSCFAWTEAKREHARSVTPLKSSKTVLLFEIFNKTKRIWMLRLCVMSVSSLHVCHERGWKWITPTWH